MKKFNEIFIDKTKYGEKIQTSEYEKQGKHIIVDQGQAEIAGYTNREEGLFNEVPVIIFGDHTRLIKYIDEPFFLGADGVKVLRSKEKNANYKYLYYALKSAKIPNTGYNRHFKWLKDVEINYPDSVKQEKIVDILDRVSDVIEKRKAELSYLDTLIKARFVEMFGDPIRNTQNRPTTEFINVVKMQRGFDLPVQDRQQDGEIPVYGSNGALDYHNVAKIHGGVITGRSGTIGKVFYTEGDFWPLNTSLFSADTHGNNVIYLGYLLQLFDLTRFVEGTGVPTLNRNMFHNKQIIDVPIDEQRVFAAFVNEIDKSKSAVKKALDETQLLFDSLMQEYFG
ncbi:restriction endonuclease subunit S [Lachnospira hominis (ex Hitch et al. 2024)]|uniref:Restriction endonuclease subunit S n=1 Tax=Lachnospira intestinalis TaxID=3133158 RepID=A0ABV1GLM3_9FIRM